MPTRPPAFDPSPASDPLVELQDPAVMPVERFVTFKVNQLSTAFERQWTRVMREKAGVTLSQWRILAVLQPGATTFARVTEATAINKGLVSRSVRELQDMGLLTATETPDDARSITLGLTTKGQRLLKDVQPLALARQRHLLSALTAAERRTFYAAVEKLARAAVEWEGGQGEASAALPCTDRDDAR